MLLYHIIIPIIDYCLCSTTNRIPAGTIRENCSAFAISLFLGDQYLLIKRIGDADPQKVLYAYSEQGLSSFNEDNWLPTIREKFKLHLNNALGISFSEIANKYSDNENDNSGRPSYRDLVSFNFQPQNIVANPNCLLYKTDIYKYRSRLQKIFDYAIGAQSSKQLYDDIQKQALEIELKNYQKEKDSLIKYNQKIINNSEALLLKAEINIASSVVPSLETSVLVEKLTTEIFKSLLSFNKLVINFFAESKINCFLVV